MEKYKVRIYAAAKRDLIDIIDYLNTLSPQAALNQYNHIVDKIGSLEEMPERCSLLIDDQLRIKGYRMLVVDNYLVFFTILNRTVQVRRILYGRRSYEWLL